MGLFAGSRGYVSLIDPLSAIGPALDRRTVDSCCFLCCRCSLQTGLHWALGAFLLEAVWRITTSILQPIWAWSATADTLLGFYQNSCRFVLIVLCLVAWRALLKGRDGVAELRVFLRALILLFGLQIIEVAYSAVTHSSTPAVCARLAEPQKRAPERLPLSK